ncbi:MULTISPECIES: copper homeostasis protein CutC [Microbacterium]|uniref:PF03932 family protein CutC n=1 Tax=Microbacterium hominis TaxID=162426 RepID=A0A2K9D7N1_9MICO|nr:MULTISPECIES: copper homeostasis protein CutC [Microbacterium]AUG29610.1 copper homeostasis protein CutC [Microbacterium hominis]
MTVAVEIAVQDAAGSRAAMDAGASRLELCQALGVGGLTPSIGLVEAAVAGVGGESVNVLVRPRGGGFVYDAEEVALVAADIAAIARAGAGGVVVGALTAAGAVDAEALRRWREAAGDLTLVFHRAIDASADPLAVLERLAELGVDRVLTSGGADRSIDGVGALRRFVALGAGVEIMAGGGIRVPDIPAIVATGVDAVHLSARAVAGRDTPAGPGGGASGHDVTDAAVVAAAVAAVGATLEA